MQAIIRILNHFDDSILRTSFDNHDVIPLSELTLKGARFKT